MHISLSIHLEIEAIRDENVKFQLHCIFLHSLLNFNQSLIRMEVVKSRIRRNCRVTVINCVFASRIFM